MPSRDVAGADRAIGRQKREMIESGCVDSAGKPGARGEGIPNAIKRIVEAGGDGKRHRRGFGGGLSSSAGHG